MAKKVAPKQYNLKRTQKKVITRIERLAKCDEGFSYMLEALKHSKRNEFTQIVRHEKKSYDDKWITTIEDTCDAIDMIIKNPNRFIKETRNVVPTAQAKRITSESVIHLASHTQFVRSVDENGNVTPEKILSISAEDDFAIYENRVVYTLIKKLIFFIEKRYQYISKYTDINNYNILSTKSQVTVGDFTYELETKARLISRSTDAVSQEANKQYIDRITNIRKRVNFYIGSEFVKLLGNDVKPVKNPLMKTNLLAKNPYYKAVYRCWKFIDTYNKLGVKYTVSQVGKDIDEKYAEDLYYLSLANMLVLKANEINDLQFKALNIRGKTYTPKTARSIEDEVFDNSRFTKDMVEKEEEDSIKAKELDLKKQIAEQKRLKKEEQKQKLKDEANAKKEKERLLKEKLAAKLALKEKLAKEAADQRRLIQEQRKQEALKQKQAALEERRKKKEQEELEMRLLKETRVKVAKTAKKDATSTLTNDSSDKSSENEK